MGARNLNLTPQPRSITYLNNLKGISYRYAFTKYFIWKFSAAK
ncbi:hypothetical protein PspLS_07104 [Pyricularia sp. CBS 133598]|nr:hypothetical protein PspLS_07104 [Pyricularia sp. CBS 133598]